jgi:hypothetical protein
LRGQGGGLPRKYRITIREIRKAERREKKGKYLGKKERERDNGEKAYLRGIRKAERKELGELLEINRNLEKFKKNFVWLV